MTLSRRAPSGLPLVAIEELQRHGRRGLEMHGRLRRERNRDRRNAEQEALGRRRHRARVDRVVAHVRAEIDAGDHEVGKAVEQPRHGEVHAVGRRAVDEQEAAGRAAHRQRPIERQRIRSAAAIGLRRDDGDLGARSERCGKALEARCKVAVVVGKQDAHGDAAIITVATGRSAAPSIIGAWCIDRTSRAAQRGRGAASRRATARCVTARRSSPSRSALAALAALPVVAVLGLGLAPGARRGVGAPRGDRAARVRRQHARARRAGRRRRGLRRNGDRLARHQPAVSRRALFRMGAAAAAGDARLRDGLRLHRLARLRGTGADRVAARVRLVEGRLLVSRRALARRRRRDVHRGAVSVRLSARAHGFPRAAGVADRSRPDDGTRRAPRVLAHRPAARAPGRRRRHRAGVDGDAGGLRHRRLFRRGHVHHRHLPRLVLAGRQGRRGAAGRRAARVRHRRRAARALVARRGAGRPRQSDAQPEAAAAAACCPAGADGWRRSSASRRS